MGWIDYQSVWLIAPGAELGQSVLDTVFPAAHHERCLIAAHSRLDRFQRSPV